MKKRLTEISLEDRWITGRLCFNKLVKNVLLIDGLVSITIFNQFSAKSYLEGYKELAKESAKNHWHPIEVWLGDQKDCAKVFAIRTSGQFNGLRDDLAQFAADHVFVSCNNKLNEIESFIKNVKEQRQQQQQTEVTPGSFKSKTKAITAK